MKKTNFCAIFATMFVAATVITLASCSQDDEYYEDSEMFTRAARTIDNMEGDLGGSSNSPFYGENYCGIAAVMSMLGVSLDNDYWYARVMDAAEEIDWDPSSGSGLTDGMILAICAKLREKYPCAKTENLPSSNTTVEADAKAKFNALKNDAEALKKISIGVQVNTLKDGAVVTVLHWTGVSSVDGDRIIPRNCSLVDETNHIYTAFYVSQIKAIVY